LLARMLIRQRWRASSRPCRDLDERGSSKDDPIV
jgi:hypothetical protein